MEKLKWVCDQGLRDSRDGTNLSFEKDRAYGFSWPQRNYRCSFCKKEFKSAQALGGHMNVHRRDRARMRLSPSWDSPNPNPNPNPSFSLSSTRSLPSTAFKFLPHNMPCHSTFTAVINSPSSASLHEEKVPVIDHSSPRDVMALCRGDMGKKNEGTNLDFTGFTRMKDSRVWKANELRRLDLNLGLLQDAKEDLDLELRLGYS